jgi:hypothetical protein
VTAREDVGALLDLVQFDDTKEMGHCMCCGDPTFELYAGAALVVSLGFHHGITLRWPGGPWPGDAHLTEEAGDRLCAWLAKRGVTGPAKEVAERRRSEGVAAHRDRRQDALLPDGQAAALRTTEDPAAGVDLLVGWFPEANDGVLLAFRLLGAAKQEDQDPVSEVAKDLLRRVDAEVALPVARTALADPEAALGVGLWLLPVLARPDGGSDALAALLVPAARRLLSDPDPDVRRYGVEWTARVPRPEALDLVRAVLTGRVRDDAEVAGSAPAAEDPEIVAAALFALLAAGDRDSLPRMREIAAGWEPEPRAAFEKAAAKLTAPAATR